MSAVEPVHALRHPYDPVQIPDRLEVETVLTLVSMENRDQIEANSSLASSLVLDMGVEITRLPVRLSSYKTIESFNLSLKPQLTAINKLQGIQLCPC